MFPKVKKSGKEPKVGAEVTLGEVSHKTTVRHHILMELISFTIKLV